MRPVMRPMTHSLRVGSWVLCCALAVLALAVVARAEPPPADPNPLPPANAGPFFNPDVDPDRPVLSRDERLLVGARTLAGVGSQGLFTELAFVNAGVDLDYWAFFDPNQVHPIPGQILAGVRDGTGMTGEVAAPEQDAYFTMLIWANRTAPAALDKGARPDVLYAQVFRQPDQYRGDLLHFEGQLKRVRRFEPQLMARQGGVRDYYEGWMFLPNDDQICLVFTELPPGLKASDKLDVKVGFTGYFFKKFRYSSMTKQHHDAPMLIGRTVTLLDPPTEEAAKESWAYLMAPLFVGLVALTILGVVALGFWFRRGDAKVWARLDAARHKELVVPEPDAPPAAMPPERNRLAE